MNSTLSVPNADDWGGLGFKNPKFLRTSYIDGQGINHGGAVRASSQCHFNVTWMALSTDPLLAGVWSVMATEELAGDSVPFSSTATTALPFCMKWNFILSDDQIKI